MRVITLMYIRTRVSGYVFSSTDWFLSTMLDRRYAHTGHLKRK